MATLFVRSPDGVEREIALVKRITTVGSDAENDVAVADPALPRTALHIHFDGRDYNAAAHDGADMAVNGKRRAVCRLGPGDRIQVAGTARGPGSKASSVPPIRIRSPGPSRHVERRFPLTVMFDAAWAATS